MNKKKMTLLTSAMCAVALLIGVIFVGGDFEHRAIPAKGTETDYSISFDKTTNKIGTEPFTPPTTTYSGSGYATTGLGNKVAFDYNSFFNPATSWQLIKPGGYFTNTQPISGLKSITLTKGSSSTSLQVYWSETMEFNETKSSTYNSSSATTFICDFAGYTPNYLKVVALGTSNASISSGSILFSCSNQYPMLTLTSDHPEMGSVSGGGIHKIGSSVTLTAAPNSGYQFVGWYHGTELLSTDASYTFAMPTCVNDYGVEGRFLVNSYNLVLSSEDTAKGAVTGAGSYDYQSSVSISAAAGNGYAFSGWYSGTTLVSSSNPYSFTMPYTDLNYVAKFSTNNYAVAITADSTMGSATGAGAYAYQGSVSLAATANSGYSFSGWYDGETLVSSANPYAFTMPYNDLAYTAKFTVNSYSVALSSEDGAKGAVTGSGTFAYASSVTISASPTSEYLFKGWYSGTSFVSSQNPYTFSMPAKDLTYVAKFTLNAGSVTLTTQEVATSPTGTTVGTVAGDGRYIYGSNVTLTATPISGYGLIGWYSGSTLISSANPYSFVMPNNDVSYVAKFSKKYHVSVTSYDVAKVTVSGSGDYPYSSTVTVTGTSIMTSAFCAITWYDANLNVVSSDTSYTFTMGEADADLYAEFGEALGSSFLLGKYPQTVVEDSATLTALASATDTDSDGYLEYGSDEYKKVIGAPRTSGYKSVSGNVTFASGTVYYFKVEPIQWRVLSGKGTATGLVMSEKLLASSVYYNSTSSRTVSGSTVYQNNYQYSTLRAMLNGYDGSGYSVDNFTGKGFLDVAFTAAEKAYITTSTVDNSAATTESSSNSYACANTSDKIFALSYQDLINTSYGFNHSSYNFDTARRGVLTDYARATGAWMSTDSSYYGNGWWWSRSPDADYSNCARHVYYDGALYYDIVNHAYDGVRPSFTVNIG